MARYAVRDGGKVYHHVVTVVWRTKRIFPGCNYRNIWYEGFRGIVYDEPPRNKRPCARCFREKKK